MTSPTIHYSPEYNLDLGGLEALHPFDTKKAGRALELLRQWMGLARVDQHIVPVSREVSRDDLLLAHAADYLDSLTDSARVAGILELSEVAMLPAQMVDQHILRPMRLAVQGTIDATETALKSGLAINLAGGFHHASHDSGRGFCAYGDVIVALRSLQRRSVIAENASVLYIDLDAHQGDGVERLAMFHELKNLFILDMYREDIFPGDRVAAERIDLAGPLPGNTGDECYLSKVKGLLTVALATSRPVLAIYNAGTDILAGDPLGDLGVTAKGIVERDRYVIETLRAANVPLVIVPSGGYTEESHKLVAEMLRIAIDEPVLSAG